MIVQGHAELVGLARSREAYPLVCGPYEVPFLLYFPGQGCHVWGELYALIHHTLEQFDHLEGTSKGHYSKHPIQIFCIDGENNEVEVDVEAYFVGDGYAHRLWRKIGVEKCLSYYLEEESRGYVRQNDKPPHLTFLQHIDIFLSTSAPSQHHQYPYPKQVHGTMIDDFQEMTAPVLPHRQMRWADVPFDDHDFSQLQTSNRSPQCVVKDGRWCDLTYDKFLLPSSYFRKFIGNYVPKPSRSYYKHFVPKALIFQGILGPPPVDHPKTPLKRFHSFFGSKKPRKRRSILPQLPFDICDGSPRSDVFSPLAPSRSPS
ncbi:hypothetical protein SUGI_0788120 [Cryptomeria japonica]|nr:hypothetical protein SUGI_0788120 [Cryptomeria japonica]